MLPITTEENDAYEVVERVQREGKINYIILVFKIIRKLNSNSASISVLVKKHNMSQLVHREGIIIININAKTIINL